jgi:hypothetical protein
MEKEIENVCTGIVYYMIISIVDMECSKRNKNVTYMSKGVQLGALGGIYFN